jgi:WD40 repeat protein
MKPETETALPVRRCTFTSLIALAVLVVATGCDRDLLIGTIPRNDPAGGSGGAMGGGTGGVAGTGGTTAGGGTTALIPDTTCESLVTTTGEATNPCGMARGGLTVAYSPDGQTLAVARDGLPPNVHLWRLSDGVLLRSMGPAYGALTVAFSPDGQMLASAGSGTGDGYGAAFHPNTVNVWNVSTGALIQNVPAHCGDYADAVAFSHDGSLLATAGAVSPIEVWRTSDWKRMTTLQFSGSVYSVRFSPDDSRLLATGSNGRAAVWDLATGTMTFTFSQRMNGFPTVADFSPDGKRIASQGRDGSLDIRRADEGMLVQSLTGSGAPITGIAWIDDDQLVTTAPDDATTVILWAAAGGTFSPRKTWSLIGPVNVSISRGRSQMALGGYGIAFLDL